MEDAVKNQRSIVFFLYKEGSTAINVAHRLQQVFGDSAMKQRTVYDWFKRFETGRDSLCDEERSGRPVTSCTEANVTQVQALVQEDQRSTIRFLANKTGLCVASVHTILHDCLDMRRLVARWVPRLLTEDHKRQRLEASQILLNRVRLEGDDFWARYLTMDETWIPFYNPETKAQSSMWVTRGKPGPVKAKTVPSVGKVMVSVFWDCEGIVHIDFLEKGVTINADYYCNLISEDVRRALQNKRRGKLSSGIILHHDNATPHTALKTRSLLTHLKWDVLCHPPYSPDLAPSDYHLFSNMKKPLRGVHFQTLEDVKTAVEQWRVSTEKSFFTIGIKDLVRRWEKCVNVQGDYIEKFSSDCI